MDNHTDRISAIVSRYEEAMARFTARLASASAADAERPREDGGWSAAQIAWHVAAVNRSFASILDGSFPVAKPADADFVERAWEEIADGVPERAQAPSRVQPKGAVTRDEALALLSASHDKLLAAMRGLDAARAVHTVDAPLVGRVSLYQIGEWAAAHIIRHNKQMKRLLAP